MYKTYFDKNQQPLMKKNYAPTEEEIEKLLDKNHEFRMENIKNLLREKSKSFIRRN